MLPARTLRTLTLILSLKGESKSENRLAPAGGEG